MFDFSLSERKIGKKKQISLQLARFLSKENILQNEEDAENVHNGGDFFPLLASEVDNDVGNNAERDTFRNAVEEGHCDDAEVSGNCCCIIFV